MQNVNWDKETQFLVSKASRNLEVYAPHTTSIYCSNICSQNAKFPFEIELNISTELCK